MINVLVIFVGISTFSEFQCSSIVFIARDDRKQYEYRPKTGIHLMRGQVLAFYKAK